MSLDAHSAPVAAVAAQGNRLLSGGYDGDVILWAVDPTTLKLTMIRRWSLHRKGINAVAWSPVSEAFCTGASDGGGALVVGGTRRATLEQRDDIESVAFASDGRSVCTGGTDGYARRWALDGTALDAHAHGRTVGAVVALPQGGFATGCNDRQVRRFDARGALIGEETAAEGPIKALTIAGGALFSAAHDGAVRRIDGGGRVVARFETTPKASCGQGDDLYVAAYDTTVSRFRVSGGGCERVASVEAPRAWGHAIAAGEGFVATGSFDGRPCIFDSRGGGLARVNEGRARVPCLSAMASGPGPTIVAGDAGELYEVADGRPDRVRVLASFPSAVTSLTRVGEDLVVATWSGEVARVAKSGHVVPWHRFGSPVLRVAAQGDVVVVGLYTGGAVAVDAVRGDVLWRLCESTGATKCVDLSERFVAVTGRYDPLRIADRRSGRVLARLELGTPVSDAVAFRPRTLGETDRLAVAAGRGEVWMVDLDTSSRVLALRVIHRGDGHRLPIKALAWIGPEAVVAGDYSGALWLHRVGRPSRKIFEAPCRLGISALCVTPAGLQAATFDGDVHTIGLEGLD